MKPPIWAYAIAAVVVAALIAWGLWSFDPFGRKKRAEQVATVAVQQEKVSEAGTQAVERVLRSEVIIRQQQQEAIHAVQTAQGSDAPLDPAVADAVRSGLERMRQPTASSDANRTADASGAVR